MWSNTDLKKFTSKGSSKFKKIIGRYHLTNKREIKIHNLNPVKSKERSLLLLLDLVCKAKDRKISKCKEKSLSMLKAL